MADENTEQMRELAEAARIAAEETRRYGTASRDTMDRMAALIRSTQALNKGTGDLARSFGHAGSNIDDAANQFQRAGNKFAGALEDGVDAVIAMGSALYQGQKGASVFNQSINLASRSMQGLAGGITKLVPQIAPLAAAFSLGAKGLAVFVTSATQQADALYNSFSALTKTGGSAADGMTGVFETAKNLGLSMNELSALTDAVGQRAGDFALFGGTVADARKRLGQMGDALRDNREQFLSLGMTMPDVTEGLANYIALQGRLGRGQTQTTEQLAASARKYLLEQDALTRALGISRQEQEAANQRALVQEQFLARVNLLRASGQDAAADRLMELSRMAAGVNAEFHEAVLALASGNIANENAAKLLQSSSGVAAGAIEQLIAPGGNAALALQQIADGTRQFQATVGNMAGLVGANNQNFLALDTQQKLTNISLMGFANALELARKEQEAMGGVNKKAQDEMTANQARLMEIQIRANETLERLVGEGIIKTQEALITFTGALADSSEKIREFFFGERDIEDNNEALRENTRALRDAEAAFRDAREKDRVIGGLESSGETDAAAARLNRLQRENYRLRFQLRDLQNPAAPAPPDADKVAAAAEQNRTNKARIADFFGIRDIRQSGIDVSPPSTPAGSTTSVKSEVGFEPITEETLKRMGFPIKEGATQAEGRGIQTNTIDVARNVMNAVPGFTRFTGFNDGYPRGEIGASLHPQGAAFDFTLAQHPSPAEGQQLVNRILGLGASKALDEYNNPSSRATGKHIHVEVPLMARGGITDGVSIAGEAGPEAVVPLPDGRAIPVQLDLSAVAPRDQNAAAREIDFAQEARTFAREAAVNFVKDAVPGFRELETIKAAADQPSASAIADLVSLLNPTVGGHMKQAAALHGAVTQESTEMDRLLDVLSVVVPKFGLLRSAFNRIESLLPDTTMTATAMPQAEIGSRISTANIGSEIGERVKEVVAGTATGTTEALQQIQREFSDSMRDVVQRMEQQQNPQLQQEMLTVLNAINRNQGRTADASQRMADVAMN